MACIDMPMFVMCLASAVLMVSAFTPPPAAVWMMNADTRAKDQSGFGNDATEYDVTLAAGPTGDKDTAFKFHGRASSYLEVSGSNSLDVCANGSFSFTTFVRLEKKTAALIEYVTGDKFGMHVWSYPSNNLYTNMEQISPFVASHMHTFSDLVIPLNIWTFIGVSYDMPSSKLIGLAGAKTSEKTTGSIKPNTQTEQVILGKRSTESNSFLLGEMSCAMMFSVGLSVDDMNRAKTYCMKQAKPYESTFKQFADGDIPAERHLQQINVGSITACAMRCHANDECMSLSYRASDWTCVLSNIDFSSESVSTTPGSGGTIYAMVLE